VTSSTLYVPNARPSTHAVPSAPVVRLVEKLFGPVMLNTAPARGTWVVRSSLVTRIAPGTLGVGVDVLVGVDVEVGVAVGDARRSLKPRTLLPAAPVTSTVRQFGYPGVYD
jgi:hypothetical protein